MTQQITQQCLRRAARTRHFFNSAYNSITRTCTLRRQYSSTPQPAEQSLDNHHHPSPPPPHHPQAAIKPSNLPPQQQKKQRKPKVVDGIDLLPFDPPASATRRQNGSRKFAPSIAITPADEDEDAEILAESVSAPAQSGPIPLRIRKPFPVNQSWDVLHQFYVGLFGFEDYIERGFLTKDLAWQSITYKSYNHGNDPYNEKLAHIGKRAIRMVTATHVLDLPGTPRLNDLNVNALSKSLMANVMDYQLLGDMGIRYGVAEVMRWKPAFNNNLERSGIQTVAGECMCAIAGAVTFSKGTVYARSFIVNRYLQLLMQNKGDGKVL